MATQLPKPSSTRVLANRFQLLRELGSGGYGVVYEALDTEWGSRVALKTLQRMEPDTLLRFKDEFRSLQDIEHPNLVQLAELTSADGLWFFTMELVEGTDFFDYVRPRSRELSYLRVRTLHEYRLREALVQLLDALSAIHASGRVHCDIKPSNIRVDERGRLVLLDFGLVTGGRMAHSRDSVLGTPSYMAPEQSRGEPATPAADMYAVGVLLYEALTGDLPHTGDSTRVLIDKQHVVPAPPESVAPEVPRDLSALCMQLLASGPTARPACDEVLRVLEQYGDSVPLPTDRAAVRRPAPEAPHFVGRADQLSWLHERFGQTSGGQPAFVYVSGESGVGKSALASAFAREQLAKGAIVLRGRCFERETVPYKAFDGIVDDLALYLSGIDPDVVRELLPFDAKLLVQVFPVLSRVAPIMELPLGRFTQDPRVLRAHTFAALREVLARLSASQPLLLVIDDLQWSDADSLTLLRDLLVGPETPNCMVLSTGRPVEQLSVELRGVLEELLQLPTSTRRPLSGLNQEEAEQLVRSLSQEARDPQLSARIAREAKGHPLFVAELLRHVEAGHELDSRDEAQGLDQALNARVSLLDPSAQVLLEILAVAGMPVQQSVLMNALNLSPTALSRRLAQLRVAHLVRGEDRQRTECYHDRVRRAVLDGLTTEARRERHRALASALSRLDDGSEEQVAYQWRSAGEGRRAARYCVQAADKAFRALAFKRAASLYEEALRESLAFDSEERAELLAAYGRALSCAGFAARAAEAYLEAAGGRTGAEARALRRQATLLMLRSGRIEEGVQLADRVLSEVGLSRPRTPTRAVARLLWERGRLAAQGLRFEKDPPRRPKVADEEALELLWAVAPSLAFVDFVSGSALQSQYVRLALRSGDVQHAVRSLTVEALLRSTADAPPQEQVSRILEEVRQIADGRDSPYLRALVLMSHGYVHWQSFRLPDAITQLVQAERLFRESCVDAGWELTNARVGLLNVLWNAGHLWKHDELFREWQHDAHERGDRYAQTQLLGIGLGYQAALRADNPEGCERDLLRSLDGWPTAFQVPRWSQYLGRQLLAIYRGEGGAYQLLGDTWPRLRSSQLLRASYLAFLTYADAGWACLDQACHAPPGDRQALGLEAERFARKVAETRRPLASALADQLSAQVLVLRGQRDAAVRLLQSAEAVLRSHQCVYQFSTASLLGRLLGGEEGKLHCSRTQDWADNQGIVDSNRWLSMFAPVLRTL